MKAQELSNCVLGEIAGLDFCEPEPVLHRTDSEAIRKRILSLTTAEARKRGIRKNTLWYLRKRTDGGRPLRVYARVRANALLSGRNKVTKSDLLLYDLVHPLFLNSMGELGTENRLLSLIKKNPDKSDKEIIKISGLSKGTFYKYKKILQAKGLI